MRFQNGSNKVVIELQVVQFWSKIILVISNQTHAARSFDFEITRMISDQIALQSVQLPLYIADLTPRKLHREFPKFPGHSGTHLEAFCEFIVNL